MHKVIDIRKATVLVAAAFVAGGVYAQSSDSTRPAGSSTPSAQRQTNVSHAAKERNDEAADAQEQVDEAVKVVNQMKRDPKIAQLLDQARGVFIVPDYAKGALVVGGEGGEGVALLKTAGAVRDWSAPAFFNIGGITLGAEAGGEAGAIAMLLMSDKAAEMFMSQNNNFSLDANAGLTIVNWSAKAQGSAGKGDVIVWADTEGAFAGVGIGVSDINRDEDENAAYYGKSISPHEILGGQVTTARAKELRDALNTATG